MTPRENLERVLCGETTDRVPMTAYENLMPQCEAERMLRDRGVVIVDRRVPAFIRHYEGVTFKTVVNDENGRPVRRHHYDTPVGELTSAFESEGGITRCVEKMFKTPDDYKALLALIRSERYEPNHAAVAERIERWGGDGIVRVAPGLEPMQHLISGDMMDTADWAMQWMENQDEILKLYDALVEQRRKVYPIIAESPATVVNYGGNVTVEIIGPKIFEQFYMPHYAELVDALAGTGKKVGCHFDANCNMIKHLIARTPLDYIEAFTPSPDTDMTLAEARNAWPDQVLWINFPSSLHLKDEATIRATARELVDAIDVSEKFIMGITETVPNDRWRKSFHAIADGLREAVPANDVRSKP